MFSDELPSTADGIVPLRLPAVRFVRFAPDTAPKDADHVPDVTVPVVVRLDEPANGDAPTVLWEIVWAVLPLKVVPEAAPVPLLLNVTAAVVALAVVAVVAFPLRAAVIVPALKLPDASRATMVDAVLAFVAFDVTVNVAAPVWFAVNVAEPESPVPDVFIVRVPLPIVGGVTQLGAKVPLDCKYCPELPAVENPVVPAPA